MTSDDGTGQRKRQRMNPMRIANLLSNAEEKHERDNTEQRGFQSNLTDGRTSKSHSPGQSYEGLPIVDLHRADDMHAPVARIPRNTREYLDSPRNTNVPFSTQSDPHPFSVRDKRVLDRWEGSSMRDWVDEEALYANVASSAEGDKSLERSTQIPRQSGRVNLRAYGENTSRLPYTYRYPGEKYYDYNEDTTYASSPPSARPNSSPLARCSSSLSLRSNLSGMSVPQSPSDEVDSSTSEISQPTSATGRRTQHVTHGIAAVVNQERTGNWVSAVSARQTLAYATQQSSTMYTGFTPPETANQQRGYISPLSPITLPSIVSPPMRSPQLSQPSEQSPSQSPDTSPPPKAKRSIRKSYARTTKVPTGARKGGESEFECRIDGCGLKVKTDVFETRQHILDKHWSNYSLKGSNNSWRIRCGWPGCSFGNPSGIGMGWEAYPRHLISVHVNPGKYTCERCGVKSYTRKDALVRHMNNSCLRCHKCDAVFDSLENYTTHINRLSLGWDCTGPWPGATGSGVQETGASKPPASVASLNSPSSSKKGKGKSASDKVSGKGKQKAVYPEEDDATVMAVNSDSDVSIEDEELEYEDVGGEEEFDELDREEYI